ncbi:YqaA family protein [Alteromonas halophila]|uniref:Membrane protein n=1 Tax=Alteromonas halophila TaxID=516698 RepID=A0A918N221_9ALTE|nr:YqaA family protein [Alteromonas halophila]GGW97241.1 membrane protein [Alteromonas halophila]
MLMSLGLSGMFVSAFLAATLLPLGSEAMLIALQQHGYWWPALLIVATAGNVAGSCVNYIIGYKAGRPGLKRVLKVSDHQFARAETRFAKYGVGSLCLAWVPVIGDPLTMLAGVIRVRLVLFLTLVTLGKAARYGVILLLLPD